MKRLATFLVPPIALLLGGGLAACDDALPAVTCTEPLEVVSVAPSAPTLRVGESTTLRARVRACGVEREGTEASWRIDPAESGIATVELTSGRVTAKAPGTARVYLFAEPIRSSPSRTVTVTVVP